MICSSDPVSTRPSAKVRSKSKLLIGYLDMDSLTIDGSLELMAAFIRISEPQDRLNGRIVSPVADEYLALDNLHHQLQSLDCNRVLRFNYAPVSPKNKYQEAIKWFEYYLRMAELFFFHHEEWSSIIYLFIAA